MVDVLDINEPPIFRNLPATINVGEVRLTSFSEWNQIEFKRYLQYEIVKEFYNIFFLICKRWTNYSAATGLLLL